nr:MAG TPA: hypothetical protein [Caudoviricetes sp.]
MVCSILSYVACTAIIGLVVVCCETRYHFKPRL